MNPKIIKADDLSQTERADVLDAILEALGFAIVLEENEFGRKVKVLAKSQWETKKDDE
jgi:hypothetical protein